jgi:ribA/ribD-fused uncharacterized protein
MQKITTNSSNPLSNYYVSENQIYDALADIYFYSAEQAFIYQKCFFFRDLAVGAKVILERDPEKCKILGRQVRHYHDQSWSCVKYGFMQYVTLLKYKQNKLFSDTLKKTKDELIVYCPINPDLIWGALIVNETDKSITGQNLLGKALMEVRGML